MAKLTPKQECFCQEFLVDLNGTQAAIRAGYSKKTARQIAEENLSKPDIASRIKEMMDARADRTQITQDRVLNEFAKLAFFDIRKIYNENGSLKKVHELDDETAAALAGIETIGLGVLKYKMVDKKGALDSIAKHLGMFVDIKQTQQLDKNGNPVDPTPPVIHIVRDDPVKAD